MKKNNIQFLLAIASVILCQFAISQNTNWNIDPYNHKAFVENKGQFDGLDLLKSEPIKYMALNGVAKVYFKNNSISYRYEVLNPEKKKQLDKMCEHEEEERAEIAALNLTGDALIEKEKEEMEKENEIKNFSIYDSKVFHIHFEGASPNVKIIPSGKLSSYQNYQMSSKPGDVIYKVHEYSSILYKDLYPNIDMEYTFHKKEGLKYSFIIHPGADPSIIKMQYKNTEGLEINKNGDLLIKSAAGITKEHSPFTYYFKGGKKIKSSFKLTGNEVKFELGKYDNRQKVVIDPWVQNINMPTTNRGLNIKSDDAGFVYVHGGGGSGQNTLVKKYDDTGNLIWTYNTTWNAIEWFGTLEVHKPTGDVFVSAGGWNQVQKLDSAGNQLWLQVYSSNSIEAWSLTFDCEYSNLMVSGRESLFGPGTSYFLINPVTGAPIKNGSITGIGNEEIRAVASGPDGNYYNVSLVRNIVLCPNINLIYAKMHNHNLNYMGPAYDGSPNTSTGGSNNGIAAGVNHFYTTNGDSLNKWLSISGTYVDAIKIPGGIIEEGSGVLIDSCGDVYVGSSVGVYHYDSLLNFIDSISIPNGVHDLDFGPNGEILATGIGYVGSYTLGSCGRIACSQAIATSVSPDTLICQGDSIGLWATGGASYSWTPTTSLNNSNISNPIATPTTTTTYTVEITIDSCHVFYQTVTVNVGGAMSVTPSNPFICPGDSVALTASGGSSYIWSNTNSLNTGTGPNVIAFPDTTTQYTVTDTAGCATSVVVTVYPPAILSFFPPSTAICDGDSVTITASGAETYGWSPNTYLTVDTGAVVTAFPPTATDIYITAIDSNGCIANDTITISKGTPPNIAIIPNQLLCEGDSVILYASGAVNYDWSPSSGLGTTTGDSVNASPTGDITYYVIGSDSAGCSTTDSVSVTVLPPANVLLGADTTLCEGEHIILDAGNFQSYEWNNSSTVQSVIANLPGVYHVTVIDSNGCEGIDSITVNYSELELELGENKYKCSGESVLLDAGNGGTNYLWNTGETTQQNYVANAGMYWVKIDDGGHCEKWDSVEVIKATSPFIDIMAEQGDCNEVILSLEDKPENSFSWSTGENTYSIIVTESDEYWVEVFNGQCYNTDSIDVTTEYTEPETLIPNVFTPNGDNYNDELLFKLPQTESYELKVYNRWGRLVFESSDPANNWSGGKQPNGVYQYILIYTKLCGNKETVNESGYVTLMR